MSVNIDSQPISILHVLTLNGRNGEYGGPVRVARELCTELNSRGHATHIFSGALKGSEPVPKPGLLESFILVKPISRKLAVSSLWSWKIIKPLIKLINGSDVVHIHFARDLIQTPSNIKNPEWFTQEIKKQINHNSKNLQLNILKGNNCDAITRN